MDRNGNGSIGLDELKIGLKKIGLTFVFVLLPHRLQGSRLIERRLNGSANDSPQMVDPFDTETLSG
jgi:hypothetical protein